MSPDPQEDELHVNVSCTKKGKQKTLYKTQIMHVYLVHHCLLDSLLCNNQANGLDILVECCTMLIL